MNNELNSSISRDLPVCAGANIRRIREQQNLSCNKLARTVGASVSFISLIERGKRRRVSYMLMKRIADELGIHVDEIIGG